MEKACVDRFWSLVGDEDTNGCWEWSGSISSNNQARFSYKDKTILAPRFSLELHKGKLAEGEVCRHKCDNGWCVNPDHLEKGTQAENIKDMIERGRVKYPPKRKGESHSQAKLTQEQVSQIQSSSLTGVELAKQFSVSTATISVIKNKKRWNK